MIIGANREHQPLRAEAFPSRHLKAEWNNISRWILVTMVPVPQRLVGSGICNIVGKQMRFGPSRTQQVEDCKKPVGRERSHEETLPTLLVVNELAPEAHVEAIVYIP